MRLCAEVEALAPTWLAPARLQDPSPLPCFLIHAYGSDPVEQNENVDDHHFLAAIDCKIIPPSVTQSSNGYIVITFLLFFPT